MAKILVLHGPNLNLLGKREPKIYGSDSLQDVNDRLQEQCSAAGHELDALQSNSEGALIDRVQEARTDGTAFMVIKLRWFHSHQHRPQRCHASGRDSLYRGASLQST